MIIYADSQKLNNSRSIYNFLDFLGDIGGLFEGLRLIASTLFGLLSSGSLMRWFISQIFFRRPKETRQDLQYAPYIST